MSSNFRRMLCKSCAKGQPPTGGANGHVAGHVISTNQRHAAAAKLAEQSFNTNGGATDHVQHRHKRGQNHSKHNHNHHSNFGQTNCGQTGNRSTNVGPVLSPPTAIVVLALVDQNGHTCEVSEEDEFGFNYDQVTVL